MQPANRRLPIRSLLGGYQRSGEKYRLHLQVSSYERAVIRSHRARTAEGGNILLQNVDNHLQAHTVS